MAFTILIFALFTLGRAGSPVGCPSAPSRPDDRRNNSAVLRVAAYNADFLFTTRTHSDATLVCPGSGCDWKNDTIAKKHLAAFATELARLNPDIIGLEELEDCYVLGQLRDALPPSLKAAYKPYLVLGKDSYTGQNPGILTKVDPMTSMTRTEGEASYPVPGSACGSSKKGSHGVSKHYITRFKLSKATITLIGVHFLAGPTDADRCVEREAQATVIAKSVAEAKSRGDEIIVLGDFNDYSDTVLDSYNHKPISKALKIIREAGDLVNVAQLVAKNERYTEWYNKDGDCVDHGGAEHSMIDHMLVSAKLYSAISHARIPHDYTNGCGCLYSDHWPIVVDFSVAKL